MLREGGKWGEGVVEKLLGVIGGGRGAINGS